MAIGVPLKSPSVREEPFPWRREDVLALSEAWGDGEWLRQQRLRAWEHFLQIPMPTPRDEAWKKTDLRLIRWKEIRPYSLSPASEGSLPEPFRLGEGEKVAGLLVQRDGWNIHSFLQEPWRRAGVLLLGLREALQEGFPWLRERLFQGVSPELHKFTALHIAFLNGGTVVFVPPGVEVEEPLFIGSWHGEEGGHASPHTLIVLGEGSSATVVEVLASPSFQRQTLATEASEVFLEPYARLHYITFQEWGDGMMELATRRVHLERGANLRWHTLVMGARWSRSNLEAVLGGEGAEAEMLGFAFASQRQHVDQHTLQDHRIGHTRSNLLFKVALKDRSTALYRGSIRIHPKAQRSDAYQANRNLLLSEGPRVDTTPLLEIQANDVRCTHGASVGKVDPEQMFYLRTRGLEPTQAEQLLVEAFFIEVADQLPTPWLKERLEAWVARKLQG